MSRCSCRVLLINRQNIAGAPVILKGITSDLQRLNLVQNTIRYSQPSLIQILLNIEIMSILVKYFIPFRLFKDSFVRGSRQQSLTKILFRPQQLTQKQRPLSSFLINRIGNIVEEELGQINPFFRFSSSQAFKAYSLLQDIAYSSLNRGVLPLISLILQLYSRCRGSLLASFREKTSLKSQSLGRSSFVRSSCSGRDSWQSMSLIITENTLYPLQIYTKQAWRDIAAMLTFSSLAGRAGRYLRRALSEPLGRHIQKHCSRPRGRLPRGVKRVSSDNRGQIDATLNSEPSKQQGIALKIYPASVGFAGIGRVPGKRILVGTTNRRSDSLRMDCVQRTDKQAHGLYAAYDEGHSCPGTLQAYRRSEHCSI